VAVGTVAFAPRVNPDGALRLTTLADFYMASGPKLDELIEDAEERSHFDRLCDVSARAGFRHRQEATNGP